jgi:hypothetical protein
VEVTVNGGLPLRMARPSVTIGPKPDLQPTSTHSNRNALHRTLKTIVDVTSFRWTVRNS